MSLLSGIHESDVVAEPFPHVVVRNALDQALCARLMAEFPPVDVVSQGRGQGSNRRFSYAASKVMADARISDTWKQIVRQHIAQPFLDELLHVFRQPILALYPHFETTYGGLETLRAGVRGTHNFHDADVLLDAQICVNTPVTTRPTSVRGPHVDRADKLFAGLFYLRPEGDDSQGGDLQLFRVTDRDAIRFRGRYTTDDYVDPVATVTYERNTLIVFLNSWTSIHGVTVRSLTSHPRLFVNLIGEVRQPLFSLPRSRPRGWKRFTPRLPRWLVAT